MVARFIYNNYIPSGLFLIVKYLGTLESICIYLTNNRFKLLVFHQENLFKIRNINNPEGMP